MKRHLTPRFVLGAAVLIALALADSRAPTLAQAGRRTAAPQIDPKALEVLQAMDDAYVRAEGLVATYRNESFRPNGQPAGTETTTLRLSRPNMYFVESTTGPSARRIFASDGTTRFTIMGANPARCTTSAVAPQNDSREVDTFNPIYWSFYNLGEWQIRSAMLGHWVTKWRLADPGLRSVRYVGRETLAGAPADIVEWTYTIGYNRPQDDPIYTSRLAIGPDHFVRRIETTSTSKNEYEGRRIIETVSDLQVTPRKDREEFAYRTADGVACKAVNPEDAYTTGSFADLPIGSKAPDFTLKTSRGETIRLSAFLAKHKVVLMNYWGYG